MCRKNTFVVWEHCGHQERRTYNPCGRAPGGFLGGPWSLSCDGVFRNQVLKTYNAPGLCRDCGGAQWEWLRGLQVHYKKLAGVEKKREERLAREREGRHWPCFFCFVFCFFKNNNDTHAGCGLAFSSLKTCPIPMASEAYSVPSSCQTGGYEWYGTMACFLLPL
jgi:hypothetical protein